MKIESNFQEVLPMKAEETIVTHDLLRIVSVYNGEIYTE